MRIRLVPVVLAAVTGLTTGPAQAVPDPATVCPAGLGHAELSGEPACLQEVRFPAGRLTLAGQWFTPPGPGPFPAAVVIRGSGESRRGNRWTESLAAVLLSEGVGVLVPDKRGSGRSEGDWRTADFGDLADDALAAVRHLSGRPEVEAARIGLMGLSQGGQVAPVAAARSDAVAFVINVVGSGVPLLESVRYEMLHAFREEGLSGRRLQVAMATVDTAIAHVRGEISWDTYRSVLERAGPVLGEKIVDSYFLTSPDHWRWNYFRRLGEFDAGRWWRRVDQPSLVLLGGDDTNTPADESARRIRAAFRASGNPDVTVEVFEDLGHALWRHAGPRNGHGLDPEVRATLAAWLDRVATPAPPSEKPRVAILVYDGVQVIDHAIPYEVFGQFDLNDVYTVAEEPDPITTYMGMRILPNHTFGDAPPPDVLVLPGGAGTRQVREDPEIGAWITDTAEQADHVLTICTGVFMLVDTGLLDGKRVTTWYDRQGDLRRAAPAAEVVEDEIFVESGKLVTAAGTGIEGSLRVLEKLHGPGWREVVRLNMEYQPVPEDHRVPRVELADLHLPDGIYGVFPWRDAELVRFEGDREVWTMTWRFSASRSRDSLRAAIAGVLVDDAGWQKLGEESNGLHWSSLWRFEGRKGESWRGRVELRTLGAVEELRVWVHRKDVHDGE